MNKRGMKVRRAAMVASGVAVAATFGLTGAGMASAAAPALKIKPNATWTIEVTGAACEVDTFNTTTHHFTSDLFGDKGTWSGGGSTISMAWTKGEDAGGTFSGAFTKPPKEYAGSFGGLLAGETGELVKGAVSGC
jgi:hypothetical protein